MAKAETIKVEFEVERETKNTVRYAEVESDALPAPAIGTLYVQRWALGKPVPQKLTVTITPASE